MLGHVPIVNGAIGVTRCQDLGVACSIAHIRLTVVDVVLMEGLLGLHHGVRVELGTVEEDSVPAEGIRADAGGLVTSVARVERPCERPLAITLPLEGEGDVVEATSDVSIVTDEATGKDRVPVVYHALRLWLCLAHDTLGRELGEVHLTIV